MRKYITSDLHLNHANIIKYCDRPFDNVWQMNKEIIKGWNSVVSEKDMTYVLGDICAYSNPFEWLDMLNGRKILICGNHDRFKAMRWLEILYDGIPLLLIHSPVYKPNYDGWIVHGHFHNKTPLVSYDRKLVNVSVENTGYKPILMDEVIEKIKMGVN